VRVKRCAKKNGNGKRTRVGELKREDEKKREKREGEGVGM